MHHKISLIGKLGRDVEMRFTPDGKEVANFSLAVSDRKNTIWFRIAAFGNTAKNCNEYLSKGSTVAVEGRLSYDPDTKGPRIWTTKEGKSSASFEVTADQVVFISTSKKEESDALPF